ncbi:MAG: F0F1 ATP synthase subunit B [Synechococcales cyanobacterium T60_A2020_003]|nr:F0F1 ATP synthase subunit B [Synechococcales cyanobacterium T60_A2020_003]
METLIQLANVASLWIANVPEEGFALNFNLLETNLINLVIIIFVLVYFGRKTLGNMLAERSASIATAIQEAEERKQKAASSLAEQQQRLAQAKAEAEKIIEDSKQKAQAARDAILAEAAADIAKMRATAAQDLDAQQDKVLRELRQQVVAMAMQTVESKLKSDLNDDSKRHLVDRSIAMLGGNL